MDPIEQTRAGLIIRVRAKPNSRTDAVLGLVSGRVSVSVRASPEKGKANASVIAVLAAWLAVPKSTMEVLSGLGARDKRILVRGLTAKELRARIQADGRSGTMPRYQT